MEMVGGSRALMAVVVVVVLSLMAVNSTAAPLRRSALVGEYKPIKDVKDAQVVEMAKYAVSENNKVKGSKLEYVEVLKGEMQIVKGINYRLTITARQQDSTDTNYYITVVYQGLSAQDRTLVSFRRLVI